MHNQKFFEKIFSWSEQKWIVKGDFLIKYSKRKWLGCLFLCFLNILYWVAQFRSDIGRKPVHDTSVLPVWFRHISSHILEYYFEQGFIKLGLIWIWLWAHLGWTILFTNSGPEMFLDIFCALKVLCNCYRYRTNFFVMLIN